MEIHGHRGARGLLPENTLPAFEHALALGVDALELDVGITRDGVPVVHHDRRLDPDHTRDRTGAWLTPPGPLLRALDPEALAAFDVGRAAPGGETAKRFPRQAPCDGAARAAEVVAGGARPDVAGGPHADAVQQRGVARDRARRHVREHRRHGGVEAEPAGGARRRVQGVDRRLRRP